MCEQNASYLVKDSELLGLKIKTKFVSKIFQKPLKWSLQYANFQKNSGEHAPGPPRACFTVILLEKNCSQKMSKSKFGAPPKKNSEYVPGMKHFQRA